MQQQMRPYMHSRLRTCIVESLVREIHKAYIPINLPPNPSFKRAVLYKPLEQAMKSLGVLEIIGGFYLRPMLIDFYSCIYASGATLFLDRKDIIVTI